MKKIFIDCGGNKGQGLRSFVEMYQMDNSWLIESYEPNSLCNLDQNIIDLTQNLNIKTFN